jgi:hypothetical protein
MVSLEAPKDSGFAYENISLCKGIDILKNKNSSRFVDT